MSLHPSAKRDKPSVDGHEARRKREVCLVEIRKNKREESLMKKRREGEQAELKFESVEALAAGVKSDNPKTRLDATIQIRKLLSSEKRPPIGEVVKAGIVPYLAFFLINPAFPTLQFEAAWALTNIASGSSDHTYVLIDNNVVPLLVNLLVSPNDDVREQAVWALGNIAGDSADTRDLVLAQNAMLPLLAQIHPNTKPSMLRNATWTLSNLCRGHPQPEFHHIKPALPVLARLIYCGDETVLADACWSLSYISDGMNDKVQEVINSGVCSHLIELLMHRSPNVLVPALRTVGNIATGNDFQTQCLIDSNVLPYLLKLLTETSKLNINKEACWTISNITAGHRDQIQAVIDSNIIPHVIHHLANSEFEVKKEAAWAVSNATSGGTDNQIRYLVSNGCIGPLCDLLLCPDPRITSVVLDALDNILKVGDKEMEVGESGNAYAQCIADADGVDKIEKLQRHNDFEIYEKVSAILNRYFAEEDEMEENDTFDEAKTYFEFKFS